MSAGKKEKHRLKRQKKQAELRKKRNQNPLDVCADGRGTLQVFITREWRDYGQASIFALREVQGRRFFAGFLIDEGVAGLKDAWIITDISAQEFDDLLSRSAQMSPMVSCDPDSARQLIAGAIRHAHNYGFRLPRDMNDGIKIIGGVGDWRQADTSLFVPEFAGSMRNLRKRCIGQPVDEFLRRGDVSFVFNDAAPSLLDDEDEDYDQYDDEQFEATKKEEFQQKLMWLLGRLTDRFTQWCEQTGQKTPALAREAVLLRMIAGMESVHSRDRLDMDDQDNIIGYPTSYFVDRAIEKLDETEQQEMRSATDMVAAFQSEVIPSCDSLDEISDFIDSFLGTGPTNQG